MRDALMVRRMMRGVTCAMCVCVCVCDIDEANGCGKCDVKKFA